MSTPSVSPNRSSYPSAPPFLSGGVDQIIGEALTVLWVFWGLRVNELAPVITPPVSLGLNIVLLVALVLARPRGSVGAIRLSVPVLLYLGVWVMSMLWSWDFWVWFADARVNIVLIVTGMVLASVVDHARLRRGLVTAVYLSALVTIAFSLGGRLDPDGAWLGTFVHKNGTGGFFAVGVLVVLQFERRPAVRFAGLVGCVGIVLLSQSATALLMIAAAVATVVVMRRVASLPPRQAAAFLFSVSTFVMLILAFVAIQSARIVGGLGRDSTLSGRTRIWPAVWDLVQERPWVGWGPGVWIRQNADPARYISREAGAFVGHAHNTVLELLLIWGVLGLVVYFMVVVAMGRSAWRIASIDPTMSTFALGFLAVLAVQSFSEPALNGWVAMMALLHVVCMRILDEHRRSGPSSAVDDLDVERLVRGEPPRASLTAAEGAARPRE